MGAPRVAPPAAALSAGKVLPGEVQAAAREEWADAMAAARSAAAHAQAAQAASEAAERFARAGETPQEQVPLPAGLGQDTCLEPRRHISAPVSRQQNILCMGCRRPMAPIWMTQQPEVHPLPLAQRLRMYAPPHALPVSHCNSCIASSITSMRPAAGAAQADARSSQRLVQRSDSAIQRAYDAAPGPPSKSDAQAQGPPSAPPAPPSALPKAPVPLPPSSSAAGAALNSLLALLGNQPVQHHWRPLHCF